jgi:phage-related protein
LCLVQNWYKIVKHGRPRKAARLPVYTVKFVEAVFVLHCFQKKSKRGIEMPKEDMDIIRDRLKSAAAKVEELRHGKAH